MDAGTGTTGIGWIGRVLTLGSLRADLEVNPVVEELESPASALRWGGAKPRGCAGSRAMPCDAEHHVNQLGLIYGAEVGPRILLP